MSIMRIKALDGIDIADIPALGGIAVDWTPIGKTYRDEATLTEDDPSETPHYSNESDDPEELDIVGGKRNLKFVLIDFDPVNIQKYMGGAVTGVAPDEAWEAPTQKEVYEKQFRIRSKNGKFMILTRVSFWAKLDYKLAPSGIAKVMVSGTIMTPVIAGTTAVKIGKLA